MKGRWTGGNLRWWWGLEEMIRRSAREAMKRSGTGDEIVKRNGGLGDIGFFSLSSTSS